MLGVFHIVMSDHGWHGVSSRCEPDASAGSVSRSYALELHATTLARRPPRRRLSSRDSADEGTRRLLPERLLLLRARLAERERRLAQATEGFLPQPAPSFPILPRHNSCAQPMGGNTMAPL